MKKKTIIIDEELEELVPEYLTNVKKQINIIFENLSQNNFELIKKIAHKLKGSGKSYGFDFISECGVDIEKAAMNKETELIKNKANDFINYLETINIQYKPED